MKENFHSSILSFLTFRGPRKERNREKKGGGGKIWLRVSSIPMPPQRREKPKDPYRRLKNRKKERIILFILFLLSFLHRPRR